MFCTKCGAEAAEGAVFCTKCGAKLGNSAPSNEINTYTIPAMQDVYNRLTADVSECPHIKKIYFNKGGLLSINGFFERYYYVQNTHIQKLSNAGWRWPFALLFMLPVSVCDVGFLNFFFQGEYYFALTICCLIGCIIWFFAVFFICRERNAITRYVSKKTNCELKSPSKVFPVISCILNVVEIVLCVIALTFTLRSNSYSGGDSYRYGDREISRQQVDENENDIAGERSEYEDLSETYTNEDEGFSFMYPHDWEIDPVETADSDAIVSVARTGGLGVYAVIIVNKVVDDGSVFAAARADFEETYPYLEGFNDVEIMDLSGTVLDGHPARRLTMVYNNDSGVRVSEIQYFYIRGPYVYIVDCAVEEANYDRYEPIFDAIMDTYTITAADIAMGDIAAYDVYDKEAALQNMIEWFERNPLQHDIRVRFMEEAVDGGNGSGKYLKYELDMAGELDTDYERYGIFYVNPDNGDMVMESITDGRGSLEPIQAPMDQWYLEYYWGWTNDSGYYTESDYEFSFTLYDDMGNAILEYHAEDDSYVICNFDIVSFIEYDDSPTPPGVDIDSFSGSYWCDQSLEMEGHFVENGYALDIGKVAYNSFSIAESWRGNDLFRDDYAQPRMLIEDTLYFIIYNPESAGYEMHYLTYVPAKDSPLGMDTVYLDGDDTMPFEKEQSGYW